ncbi:MAG: cytidylate kinase-like family protein [Planctomycetota bacterium]|nr:cytidylate kinase-like family protein [Planctomycetota bacterium]
MSKITLACHLSRNRWALLGTARKPGPFITISRQYGCQGFTVAMLVQEILNDQAGPEQEWQVYHNEILARLARETNLAEDFIARERQARPQWVTEFFRSLSGQHIPSGFEIRSRVTTVLRGLAIAGHAIIVGQGGYWATRDLRGGLAVRLEAPYDWRVRQIAARRGMPGPQARIHLDQIERQRTYLRQLHEYHAQVKTPFDATYDCSQWTLSQVARHIVCLARFKGLLRP